MTATVEIQATEFKTAEGVETVEDFPSCHGNILMRKPKMLRVRGTYFGVMIFDMASDGSQLHAPDSTRQHGLRGSEHSQGKIHQPPAQPSA